MPNLIKIQVENCVRCGGNHQDLDAIPFLPGREVGVNTHWARCPTSGSPILVAFLNTEPDMQWVEIYPKKSEGKS